MKLKRISSLLVLLILLSASLSGCLMTRAENYEAGYVSVPDENLTVVSEAIDTLARAGCETKSLGNHGAHQTRLVSVSGGTYLGVSLESPIRYESDDSQRYMAVLMRVNADGSVDKIYEDFTVSGSTTVCVMADKNEDIWMWCGWCISPCIYLKLWHYDVSEDRVTAYDTTQLLKYGDDGYRYASSLIDGENGKIYAILNSGGGLNDGWMAWCEFDIDSKEWQPYQAVLVPAKLSYNYSCPDGNGGFVTVAERDVFNRSVKSDVDGINIEDAMKVFRSRDKDAGAVWDELYLVHVEDPSVAEREIIIVDEAVYDVKNGFYPNQCNMYNDTLVDSAGNLHVLYTVTDNHGIAGVSKYYKIYDISDGCKLLYEDRISFLYGENIMYETRMYEDLAGNFYIFAIPNTLRSQIEIWKATDGLKSQFEFVHNEELRGMGETNGAGAFILASGRSNSTPSNTASFIAAMNDTWYSFTIDLVSFQ